MKEDITGQRFGRLVATTPVRRASWIFACDCGQTIQRPRSVVVGGNVSSCGCLRRERGVEPRRHGGSYTPEYKVWRMMRERCFAKKHRSYPDYGGRGITVCARWNESFEAFLADVGPRPSPEHTLDRYPNNDGNYEPCNVRWATPLEQGANKRNNVHLTHDGRTQTVGQWAADLGWGRATIEQRLRMGWTVERALSEPKRPHHRKAA